MKRAILIILAVLLGVAALAGAGFVGFQMGARHAAAFQPGNGKAFEQFHRFDKDRNPMREFHQFGGPQFEQRIGPGGGPGRIHHGGRGFGISPVFFLVKIIALGLVVWIAYNLFKGNGWQLTLARVQPTAEPAKPTQTEKPKKGRQ